MSTYTHGKSAFADIAAAATLDDLVGNGFLADSVNGDVVVQIGRSRRPVRW
jgi:hypothetical protein